MSGMFNTLFRYREKKSPDRLGRFPQEVNIEAMPERRYLWTARVLVIFSALSFSLTIMLAMTLYLLLPLRGGRPNLMTADKFTSSLEKVEPLEKNISSDDVLTEQLVEKYVKLRHEIPDNPYDLYERWSRGSDLYWMSSIGNFQRFSHKANYDFITKLIAQGLIRKVETEWIRRLTPQLWMVQFHTVNSTQQNPEPQVIVWRAYLRVNFVDAADIEIEGDIDLPDDFLKSSLERNPYGFKVKNYSLSYLGTPSEPESYLSIAKQIRENNYRY